MNEKKIRERMKEKKYTFTKETKKDIKNKDIIEKEENNLNRKIITEEETMVKEKQPKREYKKRNIYKNILKENDEDLDKKEENRNIREATEKRYKRKFLECSAMIILKKMKKARMKNMNRKMQIYQYQN